MLNVGTAKTVGTVTGASKKAIDLNLVLPVCTQLNTRIAISRQVDRRWRLIGWGKIVDGKEKKIV